MRWPGVSSNSEWSVMNVGTLDGKAGEIMMAWRDKAGNQAKSRKVGPAFVSEPHLQLLLQPAARLAVLAVVGIALVKPRPAQLRQLAVGLRVLGARVAVAQVAREVERTRIRRGAHAVGSRLGFAVCIALRNAFLAASLNDSSDESTSW